MQYNIYTKIYSINIKGITFKIRMIVIKNVNQKI
uniref:Cytochrome b6-f complex subunit PetP n=1 Tax=Digenea simplex TaxID=945030 RepID=A0A1Z1MU04_DIGSM|nr:cytochrome b6-f complex subunit PetP [Digenea simplex]ARW69563.1 cytochrome b6-f complex subunit PetP [Digenea simplex]